MKNNKLILKNTLDPFSHSQEVEEWLITNLHYEKIILSGKDYISTESLSLLSENNCTVVLLDTFGKPITNPLNSVLG